MEENNTYHSLQEAVEYAEQHYRNFTIKNENGLFIVAGDDKEE